MQHLFVGENDSQPRMAPNPQELGMGVDHKGGGDNHRWSLLFWTYPLSDVSWLNHESFRYGQWCG